MFKKLLLLLLVGLLSLPSCEDDPCDNQNCLNGGVCISGQCECPSGFSGLNCEINQCAGIACYNGGVCVNGQCDCAPGFSGVNCQNQTAGGGGNKYIKSVKIYTIPASDWDSFSAPDIVVRLARTTSSVWEYSSAVFYDQTATPFTITFSSPILVTNENWDIAVYDEDSPDDDDIIYGIKTFNPYSYTSGFSYSQNNQVRFEVFYQ